MRRSSLSPGVVSRASPTRDGVVDYCGHERHRRGRLVDEHSDDLERRIGWAGRSIAQGALDPVAVALKPVPHPDLCHWQQLCARQLGVGFEFLVFGQPHKIVSGSVGAAHQDRLIWWAVVLGEQVSRLVKSVGLRAVCEVDDRSALGPQRNLGVCGRLLCIGRCTIACGDCP